MAKIFLLGFMGCGKSYIGKRLAKNINADFLDLDDLIVETNGLSISKIFEQKGEPHFRQSESNCLKSLKNTTQTVVALGGGTPCFFDNMKWINENGVSLYLKTKPTVLADRLKSEVNKRPLIQQLSEAELLPFIEQKIEERAPFYHQAHLEYAVETGNEPILEDLTKFFQRMTSLG
jgi:shikimate kinase